MSSSRLAAIDIGSNTVRLLLAEQDEKGIIFPLRRERIITRLGGKFSPDKGIAEASIKRTIAALKKFQRLLDKEELKQVRVVATGVVRQARNREEFKKRVFQETGFNLRILKRDEEASLMLRGVLWGCRTEKGWKYLVVDIGGWSTELVWVEDTLPRYVQSLDLGAISLCEKFLGHDPPLNKEIILLHQYIEKILIQKKAEFAAKGLRQDGSAYKLIGTAGTMTTLAAIDQGLSFYDPQRINNHPLSLFRIKKIYQELISLPAKERLKIPGLEKGREDLILAGTAIILQLMKVYNMRKVTIVDSGLLEGILLSNPLPKL